MKAHQRGREIRLDPDTEIFMLVDSWYCITSGRGGKTKDRIRWMNKGHMFYLMWVKWKAVSLRPAITSINRVLEGGRIVGPDFEIIGEEKGLGARRKNRRKGVYKHNEYSGPKDRPLGNTTSNRKFGREGTTYPHS
jgi:hypothetical protein